MAAMLPPMACGVCVCVRGRLSQLVCCMGAATGEACMKVVCNLELIMRCPSPTLYPQSPGHEQDTPQEAHTFHSQQTCMLK